MSVFERIIMSEDSNHFISERSIKCQINIIIMTFDDDVRHALVTQR